MKPGDLPTQLEQDLGWRSMDRAIPVAIAAAAVCLLVLAYRSSVVAMVETWVRSETFAHCFLALPMSLWLLWRERDRLASVPLKPFAPGLVVVALLNGIWLVGDAASLQTLREFALVGSVPVLIVTVLGLQFGKAALFPLLFMMFAWPFGDFLVPPLIDYTADFAVAALRMTGVPVFRQGNSFAIPSGEWSVIGACSGIRYLIASVFGGSFFAYITFRSVTRRAVFIGLAVVVPIVANWVRAYLIVMIGHLTNNHLAAGADHLIYGWAFFGIVMAGLFYVGMRMSDGDRTLVAPEGAVTMRSSRPAQTSMLGTVGVALAGAAIAFAGPAWSARSEHARDALSKPVILSAPTPAGDWTRADDPVTAWRPLYKNPSAQVRQSYRGGRGNVELYLAFYRNQRGESKLLTFLSTSLVGYDPKWHLHGRRRLAVSTGTENLALEEIQVDSKQGNFLVWQWYWIGGVETPRVWEAKLVQARTRMSGALDQSAAVVLMAPFAEEPADARTALEGFVHDAYPSVAAALRSAAGETQHE